jgi:glycosyltransferase involved in cell wall biosynthesis
MKIIQAVGWYHPETLGGTEVYVAGLSRRLRAAGHEVLVAAPDAHGPHERSYEHDGIPVYRYPIPPAPTRDESQGRIPARGADRFHAWLSSQRPDIVHMHTFVTGLGVHELRAARAAGARVIVTSHSAALGYICQRGTLMRWGEEPCDGVLGPAKCAACELQHRGLPRALARAVGAVPPAIGRVGRALPGKLGTALGMSDLVVHNAAMQREVLDTVHRFVVLTRWALDAVAANGAPPEKLALNRLGLSQSKVIPKPGPEDRPTRLPITLGYLGRFDVIKGVHDLVRAVSSLPRALPIGIEFRGPIGGEAEQRVRAQLEVLAWDDSRVRVAAPVPEDQVPDTLARYDVLCCPSVCHEGGPTVALEAHAVGTPVIGTRIGGLAELVTDGVNGRLVATGDWRALAQVLSEMADDPAGTIDRWRGALPRARTMDEIAADYLALYTA